MSTSTMAGLQARIVKLEEQIHDLAEFAGGLSVQVYGDRLLHSEPEDALEWFVDDDPRDGPPVAYWAFPTARIEGSVVERVQAWL